MKAKEFILQCNHEKLISRSLLYIIFVLLIYIALIVPSLSQSPQVDSDLNNSLAQHCNLCDAKSKELKIMSLRGEQYTNQLTEIQNILVDLGFSLQEVEDWYELCIPTPPKCIETIRVPATKPRDQDLTAGSDQDIVSIYILPNNSMLDLYLENVGYLSPLVSTLRTNPDGNVSLFGYFQPEYIVLAGGIVAVAAADRWNAYHEVAIPPENHTYPVGSAEACFACGNILVYARHMKVAAYSWEDYPGDWNSGQDTMGNESLKPAEELARKIALALQEKKLCQPKPNIVLKASAAGYASAKRELEDPQNLKDIKISGKVSDNTTGKPIEGAKIEIVSGANNTSTIAKEDGTYSLVAAKSSGQGSETRDNIDFELRPLQYIVGVVDITPQVIELIKKNNGTIIDQIRYEKGPRALLVTLSDEKDELTFVSDLKSSSQVKYVEPNRLIYASYVPNDPRYPLQWNQRNIRAGGLPNPSAWDIETGDRNISIAIVDTGIQYDHEDLAKFKDGKEKYKYGHDWVDLDDEPYPNSVLEDHGTHCTGIATAVMNNGKGIAGTAPNCTFMAERVMELVWDWRSGSWVQGGTSWDISRGIMDAADHEADVISMSLGSNNSSSSEFMKEATLYASNLGSILVAAAGNDANESWYEGGINYPAAYPWVIAVGATNRDDLRAPFSQWGTDLDLVAPGVDIHSTVPVNAYNNMSGTSMGAPHVAGVAALVKSRTERWPSESYASNPRYHLNNDQVVKVLIQSAVDLGPAGWDQEYGYGKVDAARALRCVNISGSVLEAVLNVPIAGAEVRATSIEGPPGVYSTNENSSLARISPDGDYYIRVPPGIYQICAMAFGYMPSCGLNGAKAELPAFDFNGNLYRDNRDFRLVPFPCNVTGRVNDSSTGQSVTGASIYVDGPPSPYPPHPKIHYETKTNSSGCYYFLLEYGVDTNGIYNVTASKEGYQDQMQSFDLNWSNVVTNYYTCRNCGLDANDFNPISVNLSLNPGKAEPEVSRLSISGTKFNDSNGNGARDGGEEGLSGWVIQLEDSRGDLQQSETTAADGSYHFLDLQPGVYSVREVQQPGWTQTAPEKESYLIDLSSSSESGKDFGNRQQTSQAGEPGESKPGQLDRYVEALKSNDYAYREEALQSLQKIDGSKSLDMLVQALGYNDSTVRANAADALGNLNDTRAVEPLIQAFKDKNSGIRWEALAALGQIGDPNAVKPLIQAMEDDEEDSDIRVRAAWALGDINDSRAVDPLLLALEYEDYEVRAAAAQSLGYIRDPKAVEPLIEALRDRSSEVRDRAAFALGRIGDTRAVEPLIEALKDTDGDVRWVAAFALGSIGDARAIDPLVQALEDRDSLVRRHAAWALEKLGSPAEAVETENAAGGPGENRPPTIKRLYPHSDEVRLNVGEPITFRIEADDPDANLKNIEWAYYSLQGFLQGGVYSVHGPSSEKSSRYVYKIPGRYSVQAQAIDEQGEKAEVSWNVTVT